MTQHLICLTIDTDPDHLSGYVVNRKRLEWRGLEFALDHFHEALGEIPLTWYVRADGQLEHAYGSSLYLLNQHADFWKKAQARGDELGWHPHLYTIPEGDEAPEVITDEQQAIDEMTRIWDQVQTLGFEMPTFRMGEAWHTPRTLAHIEALGFAVDSSAIPDRDDSASGHPRNWTNAPNQPYFPAHDDVCLAAEPRPLLEVPMNSWRFAASYDKAPKLRYMNPCIHADLWTQALDHWEALLPQAEVLVWTLILHPNEAMPQAEADLLYAHSLDEMQQNLETFTERISHRGDEWRYMTLSEAALLWRTAQT